MMSVSISGEFECFYLTCGSLTWNESHVNYMNEAVGALYLEVQSGEDAL